MIWKEIVSQVKPWLVEYTWRAAGAAVILALGLMLAAGVRRVALILVRRGAVRDLRRKYFLAGVIWLAGVIVTLLLVLVAFGVAGPVIGFIVTVGLALGIFSDSAGGFRIQLLQLFQVGDTIEIKGEDAIGQVQRITLSGTMLRATDGTAVLVPNRKLLDRLIINYSTSESKVLRFTFVLDPLAGITVLEENIRASVESMPGIKSGRPIAIRVTLIEAHAITFMIQFSVPESLAAHSASEFLTTAKSQFDKAGVGILSLRAFAKGSDSE